MDGPSLVLSVRAVVKMIRLNDRQKYDGDGEKDKRGQAQAGIRVHGCHKNGSMIA